MCCFVFFSLHSRRVWQLLTVSVLHIYINTKIQVLVSTGNWCDFINSVYMGSWWPSPLIGLVEDHRVEEAEREANMVDSLCTGWRCCRKGIWCPVWKKVPQETACKLWDCNLSELRRWMFCITVPGLRGSCLCKPKVNCPGIWVLASTWCKVWASNSSFSDKFSGYG